MNLVDTSEMYHVQYQRDSVAEKSMRAWREIAQVLRYHFPSAYRWLDVGCGGGGLVLALREQHALAIGIEGSVAAIGLLPVPIIVWDLRMPLRGIQMDVTTCFDVAEHIGAAEVLVDTCTANARDVVVFGAAPPGQDGLGHIDCRPPEEWDEMFRVCRFKLLPEKTHQVKADIARREGTNHLWWVEKNLHVYQRM
jgi:hypothetical protein